MRSCKKKEEDENPRTSMFKGKIEERCLANKNKGTHEGEEANQKRVEIQVEQEWHTG